LLIGLRTAHRYLNKPDQHQSWPLMPETPSQRRNDRSPVNMLRDKYLDRRPKTRHFCTLQQNNYAMFSSASPPRAQESNMAVKKKVAKKKVAKKAPAAAPAVKAIPQKQTKTQIITALSEKTGLSKKEIAGVLAALGEMVEGHIKKRGSGEFTIPNTGVKIRRVRKPARKARMGRNPATGEEMKIPAKPASTVVRVTALKALKDMIG
jgi:nucleoid DNA-binding protein